MFIYPVPTSVWHMLDVQQIFVDRMTKWLLMGEWTTCGFSELTQLKMTLTPPAKLTWTFQTTHTLGPFIHLLKHPPHWTLTHTFTFSFVWSSVSKPQPQWSIPMLKTVWQGLAFISNTLGFSVPVYFIFIHGLWPAHLPCPSVWTAMCLLVGG